MTPQTIALSAAQTVLRYAIKKALTKEGMAKTLNYLTAHAAQTETRVDDALVRVFGPSAAHVLANAKKDMTSEAFHELVFDALDMAARETPAAWDDVIVKAARAAAPAARKVKLG